MSRLLRFNSGLVLLLIGLLLIPAVAVLAVTRAPVNVTVTVTPATTVFPLGVSTSNRYLVTSSGSPFLLVADSGQGVNNIPITDASNTSPRFAGDDSHGSCTNCSWTYYIKQRTAQGFNTIANAMILCANYVGMCVNADGSDSASGTSIRPFTGYLSTGTGCNGTSSSALPSCYDLSTPNTAYWTRWDARVQIANDSNLAIMLNPTETGNCGNGTTGNTLWWQTYLNNAAAGGGRIVSFGAFLAARYKSSGSAGVSNVLWNHGNDYLCYDTNTALDNAFFALHTAIKSNGGTQPMTLETAGPIQTTHVTGTTSLDDTTNAWSTLVGINGSYSGTPLYNTSVPGPIGYAYNQTPTKPVIGLEHNYEGENNWSFAGSGEPRISAGSTYCSSSTPNNDNILLRKQVWWIMTSGGTGYVYGNHLVWNFASGWIGQVTSPSPCVTQWANYARNFFSQIAWQNLVPDFSNTFLTAGQQAISTVGTGAMVNNNHATAAKSAEGTLAVIYVPLASSAAITVDLSQMGSSPVAKWYDPANNTYSASVDAPLSNASHVFSLSSANSEGTGDKVLLITAGTATPSTRGCGGEPGRQQGLYHELRRRELPTCPVTSR
jgi:hypothetical protein